MIRNITGPPVEDDDFYGRERESARLWQDLEGGNNILLLGPRRVGKSSMLRHLKKTARSHGFLAVEISLADIEEEVQFIQRLYAAIGQHPQGKKIVKQVAGGPLNKFFRKIRKLAFWQASIELDHAAAATGWAELGESLTEALGKTDDTKWLFLLDEVSVFVQKLLQRDPGRTRTFLNWLRELRVGPRAARHNRWFITGSIGLPTITRAVSLSDTINDLHSPFDHYGPFPPDVARSFLQELARGEAVVLSEEVVQRVLERVGWHIPFHLQNVFSRLRDQPSPLTPDSVDQVVEALLKVGSIFSFWEERVRKHLKPDDSKYALALLQPIARDPNGATHDTLSQSLAKLIGDADERTKTLRFLLDLLTSDGYLVNDGGRQRFLSPLLREYWRRHICHD
jgi:uncharacterized protein